MTGVPHDNGLQPGTRASAAGRPGRDLCAYIAAACACILAGCSDALDRPAFTRQHNWIGRGAWFKADLHTHSRFSDGRLGIDELAHRAFQVHNCDVLAVTDHTDPQTAAASPEYFEAIEAARRKFKGRLVLPGVEWNVPPWDGDEHATVFLPPSPNRNELLATFKREFDDLKTGKHDRSRLEQALRWLAAEAAGDAPAGGDAAGQNVPSGRAARGSENRAVVILNHPSRTASDPESVLTGLLGADAYGLVVGLEGGPGHQGANPLGAYQGTRATVDRWDPAVAEIGGLWDRQIGLSLRRDSTSSSPTTQMLWGAVANSDYHGPQLKDFEPGEFSETWIYAASLSESDILAALRAGTFFGAHGRIVRNVEFCATAAGLERPAWAGEAIAVPAGAEITVTLSYMLPQTRWDGAANRIDELELIAVLPDGAERLLREAPAEISEATAPGAAAQFRAEVKMPAGGMALRMRGRQVVADGPDLVFYTNPIRLDALPQTRAGTSIQTILGALLFVVLGGNLLFWGARSLARREAAAPKFPTARHWGWAAAGFTAFAVYGSLVPFNYRPLEFSAAVEQFRQIRFLDITVQHRADWVANVLLFIPITFCWLGCLTVDRRSSVWKAVAGAAVLAAGVAASVALEFTQQWFPGRTVSQNDIIAESIGSVLGVVGWNLFGQKITQAVRRSLMLPNAAGQIDGLLGIYAAGYLLYAVMPLDLVTSPKELWDKYKQGKLLVVGLSRTPFETMTGWLIDAATAIPLGILGYRLLAAAAQKADGNLPPEAAGRALRRASLVMVAFAALVEVAQLFVVSRYCELADVGVTAAGALAGVLLAHGGISVPVASVGWPARFRAARSLDWTATAAAYAIFLAALFLLPYHPLEDEAQIARNQRLLWGVPLAGLYFLSEFNALTQVLRKTLWSAPLGVLLSFAIEVLIPGPRTRWFLAGAAMTFILAVAVGIEWGQCYLAGPTPGMTDVALYSLGGWTALLVTSRIVRQVAADAARPVPSLDQARFNVQCVRNVVAMATAMAIVALISFRPQAEADGASPRASGATVRSDSQRTGSVRIPLPVNPHAPPSVERIPLPDVDGQTAIWNAIGRDDRGRIWFAISTAAGHSAHLFALDPSTDVVAPRGDVVSQLKKLKLHRKGESQQKIHTKFLQADDGKLYFASMDERGETVDGTHPPTWGSHLWRLDPADPKDWEHLAAVPHALISLWGNGRFLYALGYSDHWLYRYDVASGDLLCRRVGSYGGHVSRNFLVDPRGHVYVPRVEKLPETETALAAALVEFDSDLQEVGANPLPDYANHPSQHGIVAFHHLIDGSILFTTHSGTLHHLTPSADGPARLESLGRFNGASESYTPCLFSWTGGVYVAGVSYPPGRSNPEWIVRDLVNGTIESLPLAAASLVSPPTRLVLYGTHTMDDQGRFYVGGFVERTRQPCLCRIQVR